MNNKGAKWKFSKINNIEESLFNRSLEKFFEMGIHGLTRENIQNSLDGKLPEGEAPVIVKIETGEISIEHIPGIRGVKERIQCLVGRNKYTIETIEHMKNKLNQDTVRYISFEDINTKGLTGARNGQSNSPQDTWGIYAYHKGFHFEDEDAAFETSRGGSHGVGKIASNAASDLHIMYFANCDANFDQHLGGTVQLIEHEYQGQAYRSTGYFADEKYDSTRKTKFYPFENNFHNVFKKDTRGLKIVIPYLRKEYDNEDEMIKSVCDSFFMSILNDKLIVHVNEHEINKETILHYVKNEKYYNQNPVEVREIFTPLYVETYLKHPKYQITVNNRDRDFHFDLYFRYDEKIARGRVAIVRTIGMKIEDFKVKGHVMKPFNAVLIGGPDEDAYLKSLENESHTSLASEHINDPQLKMNAKRFISNISRQVSKIIDQAIRENSETDGRMDTDDILYVVEAQLKQELEKSLGTVRLNKGKTLVKSTTKDSRKEKRGPKSEPGTAANPKTKEKRKRDPLKWKKSKSETEGESDEKNRYSAAPEMVERVILNDKEIIRFDFTKSELIKEENTCDISLSVIDGMGVEYKDEFNVRSSYAEVADMNAGVNRTVKRNTIKNVEIKDGIAQLQLELTPRFNRSLKFVYYVEV